MERHMASLRQSSFWFFFLAQCEIAILYSYLLSVKTSVFARNRDTYGTALNWLQSFVTNRQQYVAVGAQQSLPANCISGVPQSSVLGPLLFAMYISPVGNVVAVEFYLYPTVGTVLIHSVKPELTE